MVETNDRKLPVGIQSFEEIRKGEYLYVDKTDIIWQLANRGKKYNYLSRPRRFGKSVLVDTLEAYFMGKKELFGGLKIMELETEWVKRPVIRLDMSQAGAEPKSVRSYLDDAFHTFETEYGIVVRPDSSLAVRFKNIIETACNKTGQQVAILIDEYDSPLQHSWKTPEHEACTSVYREVFAVLKAQDKYEKFVFITGVTKFTQISLFSVLNNLSNISFNPEYAALCGITKEEALRDFKPEISKLAAKKEWTFEEAVTQLTTYYDGYHFSHENMVDVFNPFSLINALSDSDLKNYWASSGAILGFSGVLLCFAIRLGLLFHVGQLCGQRIVNLGGNRLLKAALQRLFLLCLGQAVRVRAEICAAPRLFALEVQRDPALGRADHADQLTLLLPLAAAHTLALRELFHFLHGTASPPNYSSSL